MTELLKEEIKQNTNNELGEQLRDTVRDAKKETTTFEEMLCSGLTLPSQPFLSSEAMAQGRMKRGLLRVAAYIRVSSANPEQEDSYELQERYFTRLLAENPMWITAGVYSDYALSGTDGKKRTGFQRLLRHCREGRIDRIIAKSISRFARNTNDFLLAMNTLRESGVTIYFEKENLDTGNAVNSFILTTLGAIAQEESRSISENIRWGNQKRFPKGEAKNFEIYGYRYAENEEAYEIMESGYRSRRVEIVEEEAAVVRRIFQEVVDGEHFIDIARKLNYDGIPAPEYKFTRKHRRINAPNEIAPTKGERKDSVFIGWTGERVKRIVVLERYCGDMILQKKFTSDYLSHKSRNNCGEMPQYYVKNHHPAIVSRDIFNEAQKVIQINKKRELGGNAKAIHYPFSGRLVCAHCGSFYHTYNRKSHPIWVCATSRLNNGAGACRAERIYEEQIVLMLRRAISERYRLQEEIPKDDYTSDDILSGRGAEETKAFAAESASFAEQMRARLEAVDEVNSAERDRSLLKRQILALKMENERLNKELRAAKSRKEALSIDKITSDNAMTAAAIMTEETKCAGLEKKIEENTTNAEKQAERLEHLESYWAQLEEDYERREKALAWMAELPVGSEGTVKLLDGMTAEYVNAFVLSITVHSPLRYTVHWFDDTTSEVEMYSNIEDYRMTASYWDGSVMCKNPSYQLRKAENSV